GGERGAAQSKGGGVMIEKRPCELVPQIGFPLTIPDGPEYEAVRSALVVRSLNPDDPKHWVLLLRTLVQSQGGRAKRWSTDALQRLMVNVAKFLAAYLERFPGTDREQWINYLSKGVTDYYLDKDGKV